LEISGWFRGQQVTSSLVPSSAAGNSAYDVRFSCLEARKKLTSSIFCSRSRASRIPPRSPAFAALTQFFIIRLYSLSSILALRQRSHGAGFRVQDPESVEWLGACGVKCSKHTQPQISTKASEGESSPCPGDSLCRVTHRLGELLGGDAHELGHLDVLFVKLLFRVLPSKM
jgi:hypothetical protein